MKHSNTHRFSSLIMLSVFLPSFAIGQVFTGLYQGNWKTHTTTQTITALAFESDSSLWIGLQNGGLHHLKGDSVLLYQSANSSLPHNNIQHLQFHQGKLWVVTDSGVTSVQNQTFTNHGWQNATQIGAVNDIDCDSQGNLWLGGNGGVASFDGTSFSIHDTVSAHTLAVSDGDTVFIAPFIMLVNSIADDIQYFDGNSWTSTVDFTPATGFVNNQLFSTASGEVYLSPKGGAQAGQFYEVKPSGFSTAQIPTNFSASDVSEIGTIRGNQNGLYATYIRSVGQNTIGGIGYWKNGQSQLITEKLPSLDMELLDISDNRMVLAKGTTFMVADLQKKSRIFYESLDINNIRAGVNANGKLFTAPYDRYKAQFETPKGDSTHTIFTSNLWVSAKSSTGALLVASETYQGHDFFSGAINSRFTEYRSSLVKISRTEINDHQNNYSNAGYQLPDNIKYWPANGDSTLGEGMDMAPFTDANSNGYYDPENGDAPWIKGDQTVFFICNDLATNHSASGGSPIGLEVHGMVYGWNMPNDTALNHTAFVDYTFINRSGQTLDSVRIGQFIDFDLGNGSDDFIGCDSSRNMVYIYNGDSLDETTGFAKGYGQNPPVMAMRYLSDSLSGFQYFSNGSGATGSPQNALGFHRMLQSKWTDGTHLVQGGTGHTSSGNTTPTNFMFSGDPVAGTGWTEQASGNFAGDRRGIASIAPFSLTNGQRKTVTMAFGYGRQPQNQGSYLNNITTAKQRMDESKIFSDTVSFAQRTIASKWSPIPPSKIDDTTGVVNSVQESLLETEINVQLFPNPTNGSFTLISEVPLQLVRLIDLQGKEIQRFFVKNQQEVTFDISANGRNGIYLLQWRNAMGETGVSRLVVMP